MNLWGLPFPVSLFAVLLCFAGDPLRHHLPAGPPLPSRSDPRRRHSVTAGRHRISHGQLVRSTPGQQPALLPSSLCQLPKHASPEVIPS